MIRMTHLIWRNGRAYFRYRLPPELRAITKPKHWPDDLKELVSDSKPTQLKHELSQALGTRDERLAKRAAAAAVVWAEEIVQRGLSFLKEGPRTTLSNADITVMAERYVAELINGDLDMRKQGFGLNFPKFAIQLTIGPPPLAPKREPGLTDDDLGFLKHVVEQVEPELKGAIARQRPPQYIKDAVQEALVNAGIALPGAASEIPFVSPSTDEFDNKSDSLRQLLLDNKNVVTTHALYGIVGQLAWEGCLKDYDIIIDEVLDVVGQVDGVSETSWKLLYIDSGFAEVDVGGKVLPTAKWEEYVGRVSDTLNTNLYALAQRDSLHVVDGSFFLKCLPPPLLQSGRTITIYSYLAEGSMMLAYLNKLGISYRHQRDISEDRQFRAKAKKLITIKSIPALEDTAFSYSKQTGTKGKVDRNKLVAKSLMNIRHRELRDTSLDKVMVTCAKLNWYLKGNSDKPKPNAFSKDSRMFKARWVANTTRGTNDYIQVRTAIYLWDQHMNPYICRWLGIDKDAKANDRYATTELVQWLYRSAVRNGEPITLYMPSNRMRVLLAAWLNGDDLAA